jgi:glycosyltransferase involved in cell wall biosynthesis
MDHQIPMVSVLVTSYNRADSIEETIESILQQSFQDYEIVISDNCSTDNTLELLEKYRNNPKIIIHQNETNIGQFPNRNKCADLARGKYLKYIDSDDLMYPWGLELLVQMMEKFPEAGWGLCSLVQVVEKPYPFMLSPRQAYLHHYNVFGIFNKAPLSAIIKKEAFDKVNGFEDISMAGDFEMWQKLALHFPVVLMPDGIVWYRVHPGQEMRHFRKFLLQYEGVRLKYLKHDQSPLNRQETESIIRKIKRNSTRAMIISLLKFNFQNAIDQLKIIWFYIRNA